MAYPVNKFIYACLLSSIAIGLSHASEPSAFEILPMDVKHKIAGTLIERYLGYDYSFSHQITTDNPLTTAVLSPDGKTVVTASDDSTITFWDALTGKKIDTIKVPDESIVLLRFSPDGTMVLSTSLNEENEGTARVWDTKTRKLIVAFNDEDSTLNSAVISPQGNFVAGGSSDGKIHLWDIKTGTLAKTFELPGEPAFGVYSVRFSPDGSTILSGYENGKVRLWDIQTGTLTKTLTVHEGLIGWITFSPDGKTALVEVPGKSIRLWTIETGQSIPLYRHLKIPYTSIALAIFSFDGKTLIAGLDDGSVRIWDTKTGEELALLTITPEPILDIGISRDSNTLLLAYGSQVDLFNRSLESSQWSKSRTKTAKELYTQLYPTLGSS